MTDRIPLALLPGLLTVAALWAHQIEDSGHLTPMERPDGFPLSRE